jgi:hypothetical protein
MPEDRRLALVAVVVSGVIGLGALVLSMIAAREVQEDAMRENRAQSDIAELREPDLAVKYLAGESPR